MKKILIAILSLLLLTGCQSKGENEIVNSSYVMETIDVDMTIYHGMPFSGHSFKGITMDSFFDLMENKGSAIVFIGYNGCGACQIAVPLINEAAKQTSTTIYYLDAHSYDENQYNDYVEITKDFLDKDEDNIPTLFTPSVMLINNGVIIDNYIGLKDVTSTGSLTQKEEKQTINNYKELFNQLLD